MRPNNKLEPVRHSVRIGTALVGIIIIVAALTPGVDPGYLFGEGGVAHAQIRAQRAPVAHQLQKIPNLEVLKQSKEFPEWGNELVFYAPRELQFRWGYPVSAANARWDLVDAPFPGGNVLLSGTAAATPDPNGWGYFKIDLAAALPATPPIRQSNKYYVRVFPQGTNLVPSQIVTLIYKTNDYTTTFAGNTVFPSLEIVEISDVFPTAESLASVDVTLRVTNNNSKPTDALWLKVTDSNLLFRQLEQATLPALAPGTWINRQVRLDAILPPPPNVTPGGSQQLREWEAYFEDLCGPVFRALLDWQGPQDRTPLDGHRDVLLPMVGWADYSKFPSTTPICADGECVRLCDMEKAIRKRLDGSVVGYAYVIGGHNRKTSAGRRPRATASPATTGLTSKTNSSATGFAPKFGAGGKARTSVDGPSIDFTSKTKLNAASVSKLITALATMVVLEEQDINLFASKIGPYFPSDWDVDFYFQNLNFAQLLAQQSGIRKYGSSDLQYDALKSFFEAPVDSAAPASAPCIGSGDPDKDFLVSPNAAMSSKFDERNCYSNFNTAIIRLLLPRAAGLAEDGDLSTRAQTLANQYENLVLYKVFKPVGVHDVGCRPVNGDDTYAFSYIYPGNTNGGNRGDHRLGCGAAHWTISVEDMAKVLSSINARDHKILTEYAINSQLSDPVMPSPTGSQFDAMRRFRLGLDISGDTMMEKNGGYNGTTADGHPTTVVSTTAAIFGPVTGPNVIGVLFLNSNVLELPPGTEPPADKRPTISRAPAGALTITPKPREIVGAIAGPLTIKPTTLPSESARSILKNAYDGALKPE